MLIFDTEASTDQAHSNAYNIVENFLQYNQIIEIKYHQTVKVKLTAFIAPLSRGKNSNVNTVDWPAEMTELIADEVRIIWESSQLYWLL